MGFIWRKFQIFQGLLRVVLVLLGVDLGLICIVFLKVYLGLRSKKTGNSREAERRRSREASKQESKEAKKKRKTLMENAEKRRSRT